MSLDSLGELSAPELESELAAASGAAAGLGVGEGIAGDVILSRASGICAASGVGVEEFMGSRYGSTSL